ncbi:unnamed protein product [Rotaria sordida]|uniref:RING-type domain-containing protein n=1 Tax=Rotaria sordida TaxID=392033 RepID=A0A814Q6P6_9BILA|nr:unnamed protein product [Rotaria sordida]
MSRQYFDDPYGSSRRRVTIPSHQPSDSSSRRNVPPTSRDYAFPSTIQINRERNPPPPPPHHYRGEYSHSDGYTNSTRSASNGMNNSSNDPPHRRYQLEAPSTHSHVRYPQWHHDNHQDLSSSSDDHYFKSQQPPSNHSSAFPSYRYDQDYPRYERNSDQYDRRYHQQETYPSQSYPLHSNHRSVDVSSTRQHSNPVQSSDHPSSSSHTLPIHRSSDPPMSSFPQPSSSMQLHHPASLLTHFLQNLFGGHSPSFNDNDDDYHSPLAPIDLIAFALMMQRPNVLAVPATLHIHLGDLFDLLAHDETPSIGLSDSDIERIPTTTYRKTSKSKSTDDKCAICLSEYKTGDTVKVLRCKHFFHPECIDPWLKTSNQCPICRGTQTN